MGKGRKRLLLIAMALFLLSTVNAGCTEQSERMAEGEATRRAWSLTDYVPLMQTAIPSD